MRTLDEVHVEVAGSCNVGCPHCTWQKRTTARDLMPKELALRLIDDCAALGVRTVNFHGVSEPTLHPDLAEILDRAEERLPEYWLSTNCLKLHLFADRLRRLTKLRLILAVPWSVGERAVEQAEYNAAEYLKLRPAPANARVLVQMVCAVEAARHFWRYVGTFMPLVEPLDNAALYMKQPLTWPDMDPVRGFRREEFRHFGKVVYEGVDTPRSIGRGCDMPDRMLKVAADGTVSPCCVATGGWGIPEYRGDLAALWASPEVEEVRRRWRAADDRQPCGRCLKRGDC